MKKFIATLCISVLGGLSVVGCNTVDPCTQLTPPTPAQIAAQAEGVEIEIELENGTECELVGGAWTRENDDEAYKGSTKKTTTKAKVTTRKPPVKR